MAEESDEGEDALRRSVSSEAARRSLSSGSQKRKLSESRGVRLPDIRIVAPVSAPSLGTQRDGAERSKGGSPLGQVLAAPSPAASLSRPPQPRSPADQPLDLCLFLPDNRGIQLTLESKLATTQSMLELVFRHLNLSSELAYEAFALWMISPQLEVQLKLHHVPLLVRRRWARILARFSNESAVLVDDEPLLFLRRNFLLDKRRERQLCFGDNGATRLLYLDARDRFLSGQQQPCDEQTALELVATDMALTLGPFDAALHTCEFIRDALADYLPERMARGLRGFSLLGRWAPSRCRRRLDRLVEHFSQLSARPVDQLRRLYVETSMRLPTYGAAFFDGTVERPAWAGMSTSETAVRVAVSRAVVAVIEAATDEPLLLQPLLACTWSATVISIESGDEEDEASVLVQCALGDERAAVARVWTRQAAMIVALLDACAAAAASPSPVAPFAAAAAADLERVDGAPDDDADDRSDASTALSEEPPEGWTAVLRADRLCLAHLDGNGNCVDAAGSLRFLLQQPSSSS